MTIERLKELQRFRDCYGVGELLDALTDMTAARDAACDACAAACFVIPRGRVTVDEKNELDELHAQSIRLREAGA